MHIKILDLHILDEVFLKTIPNTSLSIFPSLHKMKGFHATCWETLKTAGNTAMLETGLSCQM